MMDKDHIEESAIQHHENHESCSTNTINSEELAKEIAAILRQRLGQDKDANDEINTMELAPIDQETNQKDKSPALHYKYALIGLVAAVVLLLCATFASTWLAIKWHNDLEANNELNLMTSKKSGEALATLAHNQFCTLDIDYDSLDGLVEGRKLMLEDEFGRHLQETPLFTVPATCAEHSWQLYEQGNLGVMQFSSNSPDSADGVIIGLVGTDTVAREVDRETGVVTYGPLNQKSDADTLFEVQCSADAAMSSGDCQGFLRSLPEDGSGRALDDCLEQACKCFSAHSTVELEDGNIKTMGDLEIGDKVLVGPKKYQKVYSFAHKLLEQDTADKTKFRKITVTDQSLIPTSSIVELTPDHMIYRHGEDTPVPASLLKETDLLVGRNGEVLYIRKIETIYHRGLYNPLTADGTIVVGGVLASTYISFNKNSPNLVLAGVDTGISWRSLLHAFIKPVAFYCSALSSDGCEGETYTSFGYNSATYVGVMLTQYLVREETNPVVQAIKVALTVFTVTLTGIAYAVTCLLESVAALSIIFSVGFVYVTLHVFKSFAVSIVGDLKNWSRPVGLRVKSA